MFPRGKWKILRGDSVVITAGKDAGQTGVISKVHRDEKKPGVTVKGLNLVMLLVQVSSGNFSAGTLSCSSASAV